MKIKVSEKTIDILTPIVMFEKQVLTPSNDIFSVKFLGNYEVDVDDELMDEPESEKDILLYYFNTFKTWNSTADWGDKSYDILYNNIMRTSLIIYLGKNKFCHEPVEFLASEAIEKVMEEYK